MHLLLEVHYALDLAVCLLQFCQHLLALNRGLNRVVLCCSLMGALMSAAWVQCYELLVVDSKAGGTIVAGTMVAGSKTIGSMVAIVLVAQQTSFIPEVFLDDFKDPILEEVGRHLALLESIGYVVSDNLIMYLIG